MLQNIHYLSPAVPHSARFSQREYENVVGRRLKPNMREWKKGRHRGDCISPNGQNSDGPIQCGVSYCGQCRVSSDYYYGQHSDRPGKRKRPVSSEHTDHYFRRTTLFYAFNLLQGRKMFNLLMTTLEN